MKSSILLPFVGLMFCISGCETTNHATLQSIDESAIDTPDHYIDSIAVYMLEQYRHSMNEYKIKVKFEKDFEANLMLPFEDSQNDFRSIIFGTQQNCLQVSSKFNEIYAIIGEINHMFNTIINLLDTNDSSYTFENYKKSLSSREYIKYLISSISRYTTIIYNSINYILPGMLIDDDSMVSAGFDILSEQDWLFRNISKEYDFILPLLKKGNPKNLNLFFREISKDIPELVQKVDSIESLYNEIYSSIIDQKNGKIFIKNKKHIKNISKNTKCFLDFLLNLQDYCLDAKLLKPDTFKK